MSSTHKKIFQALIASYSTRNIFIWKISFKRYIFYTLGAYQSESSILFKQVPPLCNIQTLSALIIFSPSYCLIDL